MGSMFIDLPVLDIPLEGADQIPVPKMYRIWQKYDRTRIADVADTLRQELERSVPDREGSRGSGWP